MSFRFSVPPLAFALLVIFSSAVFSQSFPGNFTAYDASGRVVMLHADTMSVRIEFYSPGIARVDFLPSPSTVLDSSLVVIQDTTQIVSVDVTNLDSTLTIGTDSLSIICRKFPLRIGFYAQGSALLASDPQSGGLGLNGSSRMARFTVGGSDHFYGTGERGMSFDLRGKSFDSYNTQDGGYSSPPPSAMNVNVPFIISTGNYGIYFDNTYKGHFDICASVSNVLECDAAGGEMSYYFIKGSSMKDVLSQFTWLTGRAPLLPKWAYGYIQSKYGYRNATAATQMIQHMRTDTIPCDGIILDLYWFKNMGDLSWDASNWPNPSQMMSDFLADGFRTIVITEPYITLSSSSYGQADAAGYFVKNSSGQTYVLSNWWSCGCNAGLLDITNPSAQSWWWNKYSQIFNSGVSGLWTDLGEPERDYPDMKFYSGPDSKVHNIYNFLWAKTLFEGFNIAYPNRRLFNLTRSGYAGIQRFSAVNWSGDVSKTFGGLAVQLPFLLNMGMSGIAYQNSDIGGFDAGTTTAELYTRWMEFGVFCPVTRAHGYDGDNGTEPWTFGASTENIVRKMIRLRYSLIPYNYSLAHAAYASGLPIARPLILEYPDDPNVIGESNAYLWGDELLVAPVTQSGQTTQTFYLPAGKWINFWNDQVINGATTVSIDAPIDEVPLLVKAGSIIPMEPVHDFVDEFPADTLLLAVYPLPNFNSSFTLYEDDGKSLAYQGGGYSLTNFAASWSGGAGSMSFAIGASSGTYDSMPDVRTYICSFHKISHSPASVRAGSAVLTNYGARDSLAPGGFFFDPAAGVLYVEVKLSRDSSLVVSLDSVDVTGINRGEPGPTGYELQQNYPNPFNPTTRITFTIPSRQKVLLQVYDTVGREVAVLLNGTVEKGTHEVIFNGAGLSSGVYYFRLTSGNYRKTKAMMLLK